MKDRLRNFSPGPGVLPERVLMRIKEDFLLTGYWSSRARPVNMAWSGEDVRALCGFMDDFRRSQGWTQPVDLT